MSPPTHSHLRSETHSVAALVGYGSINAPLAMVLLPVYVYLADLYVRNTSLSLAVIGVVLLVTRLVDAVLDPLIGYGIDRWRDQLGFRRIISVACVPLVISFWFLTHPSQETGVGHLTFLLIALYLSFSCAVIALNAWGASWYGTSPSHTQQVQVRVNATREAIGLCGVLVGSVAPGWLGMTGTSGLLIGMVMMCLGLMWLLPTAQLTTANRATGLTHSAADVVRQIVLPFQTPAFRKLALVFAINGIAASIPSVLVVFYVRDVIQATFQPGIFLLIYFICAALSMPLWAALAKRHGLTSTWGSAMLLSVLGFFGAAMLSKGDVIAFGVICAATGLALGAELALPGALLAGIIRRAGHSGQSEGAYFGLWTCINKLNLALAAGITLPLVQLFGYTPNATNPTENSTDALRLMYAVVPCILKIMAAMLLLKLARQIQPPESAQSVSANSV